MTGLITATELVNHPSHYASASELGRKLLRRFSVFQESDFDRECDLVMVAYGWHQDAYLYNAAKYLWRCEFKGALLLDLEKARFYLQRWLDVYPAGNLPIVPCQVQRVVTALDSFLTATREA